MKYAKIIIVSECRIEFFNQNRGMKMKIANGMEFINDETAIGKWKNIGWFGDTESDSLEKLNKKSGEYEDLFFLPNGESYWIFEGWTKGVLLIHYGGYEPILTYRYDIHQINDTHV